MNIKNVLSLIDNTIFIRSEEESITIAQYLKNNEALISFINIYAIRNNLYLDYDKLRLKIDTIELPENLENVEEKIKIYWTYAPAMFEANPNVFDTYVKFYLNTTDFETPNNLWNSDSFKVTDRSEADTIDEYKNLSMSEDIKYITISIEDAALGTEDRNAKDYLEFWSNEEAAAHRANLSDQHEPLRIDEQRHINISNNQNILIQNDNKSEEITFICPRWYDGVDLSSKLLYVYFVNSKNERYKEELEWQYVNEEGSKMEENDANFLKLSWMVTDLVTEVQGIVTFAIIAEGNRAINSEDNYFWQTYPEKIQVDESIIRGTENNFNPIELNDFLSELQKTVLNLTVTFEAGQFKWQPLSSVVINIE